MTKQLQYNLGVTSRWQRAKEKAGGNESKVVSGVVPFVSLAAVGLSTDRGGGEVRALIHHTYLEVWREGSRGRHALQTQEQEEAKRRVRK